jgi:putative MFS transporter
MFSPVYRRRTIMLSLFQFCQTIAGFGFITWVPIMLVREGFAIAHSLAFTTTITLLAPVGAALGLFFADRIERKWQLVGTAIGIGVFGLLFSLARTNWSILLCGALVSLCMNWLVAIFHPYAAELFPTRMRAQAVGFTFSWSRVSAIFVGYVITLLLAAYGAVGVFTMIAVAMLVIVLAVSIMGPTSNRQSLEVLSR